MSSLSTFFFLLSLLLLSSTEAQARVFPGLSFNDELIVLNIGGGRISNLPPPSLTTSAPQPVKDVTTSSSIFEIISGIIRWIMSSSGSAWPATSPTEVVDQINCETTNPSNKLIIIPLTSPVQQSVYSPSVQASPYIPPPIHEIAHPSPIIPSSPSLQASPHIPSPIHGILDLSPIMPSIIVSEMT
ncbi:hypothetical protein V6N11_029947 [Hibiscus sabdariffa]|uniref:Uncharacterized protein n=1 Tax=Hibiscus sabdariffa TaxID=183260 RepID=A0ABR2PJS9_9ROSI